MKNKKLLAGLSAVLLAASLAACSNGGSETTAADANAGTKTTAAQAEGGSDLTGSVTMAGSTSMEKLANAAAEAFMEKYPKVTVTAEFTGSGAGVEAVLAGSVDIGNSSRNLKEEEKSKGAAENIVAVDGIAVVVDKSNKISDLSKEDLIKIYTGEITNWKDVGGEDAPIVVIGREAGSGTRGAFEELLEIEDACAYANELDSTGAVMAKVASTPGAIGYVSLDVVDDTVSVLALEGVEATEENIKAGDYFLSRPFVMATNGEIGEQSEAAQEFLNWILSEEGQAVVRAVGLITVE
jgi:phosphate transport system substrate-binding protein